MVNKITINDLNSFNELGLIINDNFTNVYKLEELLESEYDYVYGYYIGEKLVGFVHVNKLYENMDIVNVVVDSNYRNNGIATKLINYVIELFDDIKQVMLEVNENNLSAISLYEKNGFEIINKRKNYYGSDTALIMKRDVDYERC